MLGPIRLPNLRFDTRDKIQVKRATQVLIQQQDISIQFDIISQGNIAQVSKYIDLYSNNQKPTYVYRQSPKQKRTYSLILEYSNKGRKKQQGHKKSSYLEQVSFRDIKQYNREGKPIGKAQKQLVSGIKFTLYSNIACTSCQLLVFGRSRQLVVYIVIIESLRKEE